MIQPWKSRLRAREGELVGGVGRRLATCTEPEGRGRSSRRRAGTQVRKKTRKRPRNSYAERGPKTKKPQDGKENAEKKALTQKRGRPYSRERAAKQPRRAGEFPIDGAESANTKTASCQRADCSDL